MLKIYSSVCRIAGDLLDSQLQRSMCRRRTSSQSLGLSQRELRIGKRQQVQGFGESLNEFVLSVGRVDLDPRLAQQFHVTIKAALVDPESLQELGPRQRSVSQQANESIEPSDAIRCHGSREIAGTSLPFLGHWLPVRRPAEFRGLATHSTQIFNGTHPTSPTCAISPVAPQSNSPNSRIVNSHSKAIR